MRDLRGDVGEHVVYGLDLPLQRVSGGAKEEVRRRTMSGVTFRGLNPRMEDGEGCDGDASFAVERGGERDGGKRQATVRTHWRLPSGR